MKGFDQSTDLGFLSTKTTTSEKVYRRRGYSWVTMYCLLFLAFVSAHVISRSEVWCIFCTFLSKESTRPTLEGLSFLFGLAPRGSRSPPASPSQSAYTIGLSDMQVCGSEYRWTSPEVGTSNPAAPTTGDGKFSSLVLRPMTNLIRVLFPAPAINC